MWVAFCPTWLKAVWSSEINGKLLQHRCFAICLSDTDYGFVFDVKSGIDALEPAYYTERITAVDVVVALIDWCIYVAPVKEILGGNNTSFIM